MPVVAFTDLFNDCLDDLAAKLATISGLQVVTDPRNLVPPCVFIDAPTFQAYNGNIGALTKLGIPLDENIKKTKDFNLVQSLLVWLSARHIQQTRVKCQFEQEIHAGQQYQQQLASTVIR